jgi:protoporphyrin/coproporphyrin ferrochelatase
MSDASAYDALLLVSFGGPERREDVIPFLETVLRGKNVPRARLLAVAEHYYHFGGKTPINDQNRGLLAALERELAERGPRLPVYWGNRNWRPLLPDAIRRMEADGVKRALAFVTSAFSSYSGCRQYRENIEQALGSSSVQVDKLRVFYNHPGFIEAMAERCREALNQRPEAHLVFTAHSIPLSLANTSQYAGQLQEACRLVARQLGRTDWRLVYQSRSGSPTQPWLGPDIGDYLKELGAGAGVVIAPIGFLSDHMEVVYDLDTEARQICERLGIRMTRAATVGVHPRFVSMIRALILERTQGAPRLALGNDGPSHDDCPADCCPGAGGFTVSSS